MNGEQHPRFLIVRLSAIGDVIHGVPVLCGLRKAHPKAFIAWVVEEHAASLIADHPDLDECVIAPRRWLKSWTALRDLRKRLKALRCDTSIDLQCLTKSGIAARLSGAKRRIGVGGEDGRELSKWFNNDLVKVQANHVIEHYLAIAEPVGVAPHEVAFRLAESETDADFATVTIEDSQLAPFRYAVLNPGAGWDSKKWPVASYAKLARSLWDNHQLRSMIVWGGKSEQALAQSIAQLCKDVVPTVAPPTSMRELAALTRRARLFVGGDTGPLHLAVAVGTPSISLHGTTRADWSGAYNKNCRRIQVRYDAGSARHRRSATDAAIAEITPKMVIEAANELLQEPHPGDLGAA